MENNRPGRVPDAAALHKLKVFRRCLTRHQYRTLRGQIIAGDAEGAMRGLRKIMQRRTGAVEQKTNVSHETQPQRSENQ